MRELVNGSLEDYGNWVRTEKLTQTVFQQVVEGYSRLREIGYYHCNLCLENCLLLLQANEEDPRSPLLFIKLTGFEEAVKVQTFSKCPIEPNNLKGKTSYIAPEVGLVGG